MPATLPDGSQLSLDADSMVLTVETPSGQLVFTPEESTDGKVTWHCAGGEGIRSGQLPSLCRDEPAIDLRK